MLQIIFGAVMLGLLWALMTMGVFITYRILDIADLTVEGSITLGAVIAAQAIYSGLNPFLATALALGGGIAAGLTTGLLHTKLKIPPLLAGILTMIALYSINLRILGKANLSLLRLETVYTLVGKLGIGTGALSTRWGVGSMMPVISLAACMVCGVGFFLYWIFRTEIGFALRATGGNPQMARAQGVNTDKMIVLGLSISNGLVALSGALLAQQQSYADIQMGTGAIIIGLASVIIGEVLFGRKSLARCLLSTALGAITYRLVIALVLEMGMPAHDLKLFTAITVAAALALPLFKSYLRPIVNGLKGA